MTSLTVQVEEPPLVLPRTLIILAFLWLVISWMVAIGLRQPLLPSAASYEPSVRIMLISVSLGLMIGWPLLRLSETRSPWPIRQTLLDLIVLLSMTQIVLWPLRLVTTWSNERTLALDLVLIGWAALAAAVTAAAIGSDQRGPRILAMLACVGMCLAGPLLAWISVGFGVNAFELVELSPLFAIHALTESSGPILAPQWMLITLLLIAAIAGWTALTLVHMVSSRNARSRPQ